MKYQSVVTVGDRVTFPAFLAERIYMREFYKDKGLPEDIARYQPVVDRMLDGVDTDGPIYIMVDSSEVKAGTAQRREGLHIDGYWNPGLKAHGNGHLPSPGGHRPVGGGHRMGIYVPPRHNTTPHHTAGPERWQDAEFDFPEGIILASNETAARGYTGEYEGPIGEGGDCSKIDLSGLSVVPMFANTVYRCNVTGLHETLPVKHDVQRTLIRLNVPGWTP